MITPIAMRARQLVAATATMVLAMISSALPASADYLVYFSCACGGNPSLLAIRVSTLIKDPTPLPPFQRPSFGTFFLNCDDPGLASALAELPAAAVDDLRAKAGAAGKCAQCAEKLASLGGGVCPLCADAQQEVAELEAELEEFQALAEFIVDNARNVFVDVHAAAQEQYGEQYTWSGSPQVQFTGAASQEPTNRLLDPWLALGGVSGTTPEGYFNSLFDVTVATSDINGWSWAQDLARAMANYGELRWREEEGHDPLPLAGLMVGEMRNVELLWDTARPMLDALRDARRELGSCQQGTV